MIWLIDIVVSMQISPIGFFTLVVTEDYSRVCINSEVNAYKFLKELRILKKVTCILVGAGEFRPASYEHY